MARAELAWDWTPLHELVALSSAADAGELHRRLVLLPVADGNPADAFQPLCLLHQFHDDKPQGATVTALLLVTDARWKHATGRLINAVAASGCVPDGDLDVLAQVFLAAGPTVYWEAPAEWFSGGFEIDLDGVPWAVVAPPGVAASPSEEDGPVVVEREVRTPLRRWAAERVVRADAGSWSRVLGRARQLDARASAAVMRGVLDAIDVLTPDAQRWIRDLGKQWPNRHVRKPAMAAGEPNKRELPAGCDRERPPRGTAKKTGEQPALF